MSRINLNQYILKEPPTLWKMSVTVQFQSLGLPGEVTAIGSDILWALWDKQLLLRCFKNINTGMFAPEVLKSILFTHLFESVLEKPESRINQKLNLFPGFLSIWTMSLSHFGTLTLLWERGFFNSAFSLFSSNSCFFKSLFSLFRSESCLVMIDVERIAL